MLFHEVLCKILAFTILIYIILFVSVGFSGAFGTHSKAQHILGVTTTASDTTLTSSTYTTTTTTETNTTIIDTTLKVAKAKNAATESECDYFGNDFLDRSNLTGEECGQLCLDIEGCTHFTWTNNNYGGTCWMKNGSVSSIKSRYKSDAICSFVRPCNPQEFNKCESHSDCCSGYCDNNSGHLSNGVCINNTRGLINLANSHFDKCQKDFQDACLTEHNMYREQHKSQPLKTSDYLQKTSLKQAKNLAVLGDLKFGNKRWREQTKGESIIVLDNQVPEKTSCASYAKVIVDLLYYKYPYCFNQLVWNSTTRVGCGLATDINGGVYAVCQYTPNNKRRRGICWLQKRRGINLEVKLK